MQPKNYFFKTNVGQRLNGSVVINDCLRNLIGYLSNVYKAVYRFVQLTLASSLMPILVFADNVNVIEATLPELHQALNTGELTSLQLVEQYLSRIEAYDSSGAELNSIIRINSQARELALQLDKERQDKGPRSLLHGIPLIIKDNYNTQDLPTSGGSVALAGFIPSSDAFQIQKLREAGAIILAKANMDEHAFNNDGVSSLGGQTKNAYDYTRNPGGSSGGTAVAIAASFGAVGLGTDTCGSITIPAALNNLVGLRPTKGLTSVAGVIPLLSSTDVTGPVARTVTDLAIVMDIMAGYDDDDPATSIVKSRVPPGFVNGLGSLKLSSLRLGRLNSQFNGSDYRANQVIDQSIKQLEEMGVTFIDIDESIFDGLLKEINAIPALEYENDMAAYFIDNPEAGFESVKGIFESGMYSQFIDRFRPVSETFDEDYNDQKAKIRTHWMSLLNTAIGQMIASEDLDAMVFPTVNSIPAKIKEHQMGMSGRLSCVSGAPLLTVPLGLTDAGLPIGLSLMGQHLADEHLVAVGYAIESVEKGRRAPLTAPKLVKGLAPRPQSFTTEITHSIKVAMTFNPSTQLLQYRTQYPNTENIYAVCLHASKVGPIIQCLSSIDGRRREGELMLNRAQVKALNAGNLSLRVYSQSSPKGELEQQIIVTNSVDW